MGVGRPAGLWCRVFRNVWIFDKLVIRTVLKIAGGDVPHGVTR